VLRIALWAGLANFFSRMSMGMGRVICLDMVVL
jgi:hypothetical protein